MKNLILLFTFFVSVSIAQVHQKEIIKFVDDNKGLKVGTGVCCDLIEKAIQSYNPSYEMASIKTDGDRYGKKVRRSDVMPGDILLVSGGTKKKINHVCIVYSVGGGEIVIADQNIQGKLVDSKVSIRALPEEYHKEHYGKVRYTFYRPQ